jgi:dienelactone hydrolase
MIGTEGVTLQGDLSVPAGALGLVVFAHGSGSSRFSPRNRFVASELGAAGLATLLFDLLTPAEEKVDRRTAELRFDIQLLAERLAGAVDWCAASCELRHMGIGIFGASTGAAAALICAAERPDIVRAVVSRGGRPDLAGPVLRRVKAPTLFIVGGRDREVLALNQQASQMMTAERRLVTVPGATHLFEEPGTLEEVARLASDWFGRHLTGDRRQR